MYNTSGRMGRPRVSRPVIEKRASANRRGSGSDKLDKKVRHSAKRAAVQFEQQQSPTTGTASLVPIDSVDHVYPVSTHVHSTSEGPGLGISESFDPMIGLGGPVHPPEGKLHRHTIHPQTPHLAIDMPGKLNSLPSYPR